MAVNRCVAACTALAFRDVVTAKKVRATAATNNAVPHMGSAE
ncbi:hypothetical protein MSS2_01141 [Mycobacterium marinum]|nr:hypothetical protein MSS2_01141 [Mycobacterium marinum]